MNGLSVGLLLRMPSIRIPVGRRIIPEEIIPISNLFSYTVNVSDGQTISPKFTFLEHYPKARVSFGDQTSTMSVRSGVEIPHTYTTRGLYTVRLLSNYQDVYLQEIDIRDEPVVITEFWPELLELLNLTRLHDPWYVGYGEVGIAKIARGYNLPVPAWKIGFGVIGLFSIETEVR
jgi:hypothetical protein